MLSKQYNTRNSKLSKREMKYIICCFLIAFSLRLLMIALIYMLDGILQPYLYLDDWKYETYAKMYHQIASKAIDFQTFNIIDKQMGGIAVAQLYFRFNAVLYYLTGSILSLRLANILFSSLTIFPIFLISKELFGVNEAKIATLIFACMPYHIIMSAFLFKDILIVLLMSYSLYMILKFYKYGSINIPLFLILTIPIQWLRTGTPTFLFGVLGLAIFLKFYAKDKTIRIIGFIIILILAIVMVYYFSTDNLKLIKSRFDLYMGYGRNYSGNINIIRIDGLSQIYKLPLTWIFSTFFPISFRINVNSWSGILGLLNYASIFIAPGYIFYTISYKKDTVQKIFFYPMLALHLLVIIAVINIPRHYYFLHFYIIICSSAHLATLKGGKKLEYILITIFMFIALISLLLWIS